MSSNDEQVKNSPAAERLLNALPHILIACEEAQQVTPDGVVCLAIVSRKSDGSGQLTATFECKEFFSDILEVLGLGSVQQFLEDEAILAIEESHKESGLL